MMEQVTNKFIFVIHIPNDESTPGIKNQTTLVNTHQQRGIQNTRFLKIRCATNTKENTTMFVVLFVLIDELNMWKKMGDENNHNKNISK
jgi:hypothetical protein